MKYLTSLMNIGVHPQLKEYDVRRIRVLNTANMAIVLFTLAFLFFNLLSAGPHSVSFLIVDNLTLPVAVFSFYCTKRRWYNAAKILTLAGNTIIILVLKLWFNNTGMELVGVLGIVGAVFLFASRRAQYPLVVFCSLAYLVLNNEGHQLWPLQFNIGLLQQLMNLTLIALLLFSVSRQFRSFHKKLTRQQRMLELKNTALNEANETKSKLFSIVSHDLRGPLGAFEVYLKEFERGQLTEKEIRLAAPEMLKDVEALNLLVKNLLEWSQTQLNTQKLQWEAVEVLALLQENSRLLRTMAGRKALALEIYCAQDLAVYADRQMLNTIVRNLISNAIKFSHTGHTIRLHAAAQKGSVCLTVSDTGLGMTEGQIESIHQSAATSTYGTCRELGSGLGLRLVKQLIDAQGGRLEIISTPGEGTSMQVFLNALPQSAKPKTGGVAADVTA